MTKYINKIIKKIESVRIKNNKCWMDLLRLAFKADEEEAKKIFNKIQKNDEEINKLSKQIVEK